MKSTDLVRIWDPFVRSFHWLLAVAFAISYFTEGEPLVVHVWAGYLVGILIVLRIVWGFLGPRHARFSDFVYRPRTVFIYSRDLILFRAQRYVGHSPAGGMMVILMLLSLAGTVGTGLVLYAQEENAGPLAEVVSTSQSSVGSTASAAAASGERERDNDSERDDKKKSSVGDLHEFLATFTLILVLAHVGGVVLASFAHRENLIRAIVTGKKRA